uniref:Uncharacterized protein n=1 Tax=Oryza sativa subsp. japonica TaxID=39947 RepID=Q6YX62_ORYSJ|nr:hypothetical protein [Oryza sativa Japonica Group]
MLALVDGAARAPPLLLLFRLRRGSRGGAASGRADRAPPLLLLFRPPQIGAARRLERLPSSSSSRIPIHPVPEALNRWERARRGTADADQAARDGGAPFSPSMASPLSPSAAGTRSQSLLRVPGEAAWMDNMERNIRLFAPRPNATEVHSHSDRRWKKINSEITKCSTQEKFLVLRRNVAAFSGFTSHIKEQITC